MKVIYSHPDSCEKNVLCDDFDQNPDKACEPCKKRTEKILAYEKANPEKFKLLLADPFARI